MLTIFTIPKRFEGHNGLIQKNALENWSQLGIISEILVFSENGAIPPIKNKNIKVIENINCNEFGTPLLDSVFESANKLAEYDRLMYANADILFFPGLKKALGLLPQNNFLVAGQRWDLDVEYSINFNASGWPDKLWETVQKKGKLHIPNGSDYFIFKKGSFKKIPSFAVGRVGWDNWMICEANRKGMNTIDGSGLIKVIHQNHNYNHQRIDGNDKFNSTEARENFQLAQNNLQRLEDMKYKLGPAGIKKIYVNTRKIKKFWKIYTRKIKNKILKGEQDSSSVKINKNDNNIKINNKSS